MFVLHMSERVLPFFRALPLTVTRKFFPFCPEGPTETTQELEKTLPTYMITILVHRTVCIKKTKSFPISSINLVQYFCEGNVFFIFEYSF